MRTLLAWSSSPSARRASGSPTCSSVGRARGDSRPGRGTLHHAPAAGDRDRHPTDDGTPHLAIAPERILITPRGSVVIVEAAMAGAIEAFGDRMPPRSQALRLPRLEDTVTPEPRSTWPGLRSLAWPSSSAAPRPVGGHRSAESRRQEVVDVAAVRAGISSRRRSLRGSTAPFPRSALGSATSPMPPAISRRSCLRPRRAVRSRARRSASSWRISPSAEHISIRSSRIASAKSARARSVAPPSRTSRNRG